MLRFSLAGLLMAVVCLSIYCAGLAQGTGIWPHVCAALTIAILAFFLLATIYWRASWRAFAVGFSVVGWLYFGLAFTWLGESHRDHLLTQAALDALYARIHSIPAPTFAMTSQYLSLQPSLSSTYAPPVASPGASSPLLLSSVNGSWNISTAIPTVVPHHHFSGIGHGLWLVVLGIVGGLVAQVMHRRAASTESYDPAVHQVDRLGQRPAGKAGHAEDIAGQDHQETGA